MPIAHVQTVSANGDAVTTLSTVGITTTDGSLLVATLSYYLTGGTPAFSTFTDSKSGTWTSSVGEVTSTTSADAKLRQFYNVGGARGAAHTFTITMTAAAQPTISVSEITGHEPSGALDKTATVADGLVTSHVTADTPALEQANELLVGGASHASTTALLTIGGTWTQRTLINGTTTAMALLTGTKLVSAASAQNFDYTTDVARATMGLISTWKEEVIVGNKKPQLFYLHQ